MIDLTAQHSVHQGDALALIREVPDATFDMTCTDPPYSSGGMVRGDRMATTRDKYQSTGVQEEFANFSGDNRDQRGFAYWCALWLSEARRVTKPGGMLVTFCDWRQLPSMTDSVQAGGWVWRGIVPWDKIMARPIPGRFRAQCEYAVWGTNGPRGTETEGATYGNGIISVLTVRTDDREHSTQKPVPLMAEIIKVGCPLGGLVFDPFCGSGSTLVAAAENGRRSVGFDLDPANVDIARRRIAAAGDTLFGGKA